MSILTRRPVLPSDDPRQPANARKPAAEITGQTEVSRLRLRSQIANIATVIRQWSSLTAAAVALLEPATPGTFHTVLMTGLALWAVYRLVTRSESVIAIAGDVGWMVLIAISIPTLATADALSTMVSVPQAVVGVTIAALGVQLSVRWSTAVLAVGISAYGWGASAVIGWGGALFFHTLYPIVAGWILAMLLGLAIERVARTADQAHQDRLAAEVADAIAVARCNFDREQLALLHDTAAATLLLVADTPHVPTERVAAQASRDLMVLQTRPVTDHCAPVDVIQMLRDEATYLDVPVHLTGLDHLWLDAERAQALVAASREALNNVDRHADASSVTIYAGWHRLSITDDGRGIASGTARGHGIDESIVGRIQRIGGSAVIHSVPGGGTTVELRWRTVEEDSASPGSVDDNDEFVGNARSRCGLALTATGILVVTAGLWRELSTNIQMPALQIGLAVAAILCGLWATLGVATRWTVWGAVAGLTVIAVVQQGTLSESDIAYAAWSQGAVGYCLLPHLLRLPAARGVAMLLTVWAIPAVVTLTRAPTAHTFVVLAAGVSAFLVPQIAGCLFSTSVRDSLRQVRAENAARLRLETKMAVAREMETQRVRRYSGTVDRLLPLLRTLSQRGPITEGLRRQARAECRMLRALFDESGPESTLLSKRIQSLIGRAEMRGLNVTAHVDSDLPTLSLDTAERLLSHIATALERAATWARITLTTAHTEVDLSVVCDVSDELTTDLQEPSCDGEVVVTDDTMWMTLRAG